jgi:hypothetical protein
VSMQHKNLGNIICIVRVHDKICSFTYTLSINIQNLSSGGCNVVYFYLYSSGGCNVVDFYLYRCNGINTPQLSLDSK